MITRGTPEDTSSFQASADSVMQAEAAKHKRMKLVGQLRPKPGQLIWKMVNGQVMQLTDSDYVGGYALILSYITREGKWSWKRNTQIKQDPNADGYVVSGSRKAAVEKFKKMGLLCQQ